MNILEIYKKYQIMPQQAEHQLFVAGVADLICDNIARGKNAELLLRRFGRSPAPLASGQPPNNAEKEIDIDRDSIIKACLLHDMGNIVKFDFEVTHRLYPGLFEAPKDREFWEKVQSEFLKEYSSNSHEATINIIIELGVSQRIRELVDCVGFDQGKDNAQSADFSKKICAYSDMRVGPKGVVSLEERMVDLRVRYKNRREGVHKRDEFENSLREIEKQIFAHCKIRPEEITNESIKEKLEVLRNYGV